MRRTTALGLVALAALAATAVTATTVFGGGSEGHFGYAALDVKMRDASEPAARAKKGKKPTVIYLSSAPTPVDSGALGANIDVRLASCPNNARVIEGGIETDNFQVDVQGTYIGSNRREYHVLIQDEGAPGTFQLASHLTCLKGKSQG
jgi:hypothetical protein